MSEIGIRELKQRASQILREVREKGQAYTITYQGKPCGLLVPYAAAGTKETKKRKGRGKDAKIVSLRGIWKDGPEVSWEEFVAVKKIWTAHVDKLAGELLEAGEGKDAQGG